MGRYIWGKRNKIHIIDIRETIRGLVEAVHFLKAAAMAGGRFIFVGTKRQAQEAVRAQARRTGMYFVAERWLGGTLTNLSAIRGQVKKLDGLELMERDGTMDRFNKKQISRHNRTKRRILRNLEGIRGMDNLPTAMIVVDPRKEHIAVQEAFRLRVPLIAILDTDCDPDQIDVPIPANDDAVRSVDFLLGILGNAAIEGRLAGGYPIPKEAQVVQEAPAEEAAAEEAAPAQ